MSFFSSILPLGAILWAFVLHFSHQSTTRPYVPPQRAYKAPQVPQSFGPAPYAPIIDPSNIVFTPPTSHFQKKRLAPKKRQGTMTLGAKTIFLDPGHYGGSLAEMERRLFSWPQQKEALREGELSYRTATLLKKKLEAVGANVVLSRGAPPKRPIDISKDHPWVQTEARLKAKQELSAQLISREGLSQWWEHWRRGIIARTQTYAMFNRADLRHRALLANLIRPDLSLSLHYNTTARLNGNGILVFVPGNVLPGEWQRTNPHPELLNKAQNPELMRKILIWGRAIGRNLKKQLGTIILEGKRKPHFTKLPVFPNEGVYARNLWMTREVIGPVLLIEGPCMNHQNEFFRLQAQPQTAKGENSRVEAYAEGIFQALRQSAGEFYEPQP